MKYYDLPISLNEEYLKGIVSLELCEINLSKVDELEIKLVPKPYFQELEIKAFIGNEKLEVSVISNSAMSHSSFLDKVRFQLNSLEKKLSEWE